MRPESSPIDEIEPLIVTADDGTLFHVSAVSVGGPDAPYPVGERMRWYILDTMGRSHIGPPIADRAPEAAQRAVSEWWREQRRERV